MGYNHRGQWAGWASLGLFAIHSWVHVSTGAVSTLCSAGSLKERGQAHNRQTSEETCSGKRHTCGYGPSGKVVAGALGSQFNPNTSSSFPWLSGLGGCLASPMGLGQLVAEGTAPSSMIKGSILCLSFPQFNSLLPDKCIPSSCMLPPGTYLST